VEYFHVSLSCVVAVYSGHTQEIVEISPRSAVDISELKLNIKAFM
jgi:hypothetical protein